MIDGDFLFLYGTARELSIGVGREKNTTRPSVMRYD
jgi:hypothetical protein